MVIADYRTIRSMRYSSHLLVIAYNSLLRRPYRRRLNDEAESRGRAARRYHIIHHLIEGGIGIDIL